ncbi:hypothetical protein K501DRAFT_339086 [Backusella circina FSU 941]|nr:hypothetical protein K501DRAFT_339086 [Backusella circina FSU 941]
MTEDLNQQQKYKDIKRKLSAAIELNETLKKNYKKAKKKIRTLTYEKSLLLDSIVRINHSSDELTADTTSSSSDSETEVSLPPKQWTQRTRIPSSITTKATKRDNSKYPIGSSSSIKVIPPSSAVTTVVSAPPKRSKISKINVKTRRVQPIERDDDGHPRLPQQIGVLTVVHLGRIETERDTFHNERYIFPIGYSVKRTYPSMMNPHTNTIVTCSILDGGDGPRFHIVSADQPNDPIIANSATGAWSVVVRRSNEIRHREHSNSASGPDYYGFKHPTIAKMIQDLPGTRQLSHYVWQHFEEMEPRAAKGVMAAAEKKRDNLELMGSANRKAMGEMRALSPIKMDDSDELSSD